jgi:hypothetical protein
MGFSRFLGNNNVMKKYRLFTAGLVVGCMVSGMLSAEEVIVIEDEGEAGEIIVIDDESAGDDEVIVVDDGESEEISIESEEITIESEEIAIESDEITIGADEATETDMTASTSSEPQTFTIGIDRAWLEHAVLVEDNRGVDDLSYGHVLIQAEWKPGNEWEGQLEARIDGYSQDGNPSWHDVDLDYGDNWIRYRGDSARITVGTQTIIWGRIDEIPPSDRLSTIDANRLNLDDLPERRRSRATIRAEIFGDESKLDLVYMPTFREAELPDADSIWYPIDRNRQEVLGVELPALISRTIRPNSRIVDNAPNNDHAVGLRYSSNYDGIEYALTAQHGRQTMPYFTYNPFTSTFVAQYPRSTALGGDLAFENEGITWRFEAVYLDDLPATSMITGYTDDADGANWAAGMEFYPGDADIRVNLQLAGNHFFEDNLLERENVYNVNGSVEIPFAENAWRANIRFFAGLDKKDIYFNPEIAFVDWEPHELYIEAHYFDGADGTLGGFHEDHSLISVGWRASF